jgi:hypothetical protein
MESESQKKQILEHIEAFGSITPIEALNLFGCFRLSARIWDLRHEGHSIRTNIITDHVVTRKNRPYTVNYAKYTLAL